MSEPRIIEGMPYEQYAADPAINGSLLAAVHEESLLTVRAMIEGKVERESDALDFGTCFHSLLLENKVDYVERPNFYPAPAHHEKVKNGAIKEGDALDWNANASYCKEWESKQGKIIQTEKDVKNLIGMVAACRADKDLVEHLKGKTELSIFSEISGRCLKIRVDLLPEKSGICIDFKKARSAKPSDFIKQAYTKLYHLKMALYCDVLKSCGMPIKEFWLVAVEDNYPYNTYIAKFQNDGIGMISDGRNIYRKAYGKLMAAIENNHWPSYGSSEGEDHLTPWMQGEIESRS